MNKKMDFYCNCCKKSMRISYELSSDGKDVTMPEMTIKCHTHKCVKRVNLKKYTQNTLVSMMTRDGKVYV